MVELSNDMIRRMRAARDPSIGGITVPGSRDATAPESASTTGTEKPAQSLADQIRSVGDNDVTTPAPTTGTEKPAQSLADQIRSVGSSGERPTLGLSAAEQRHLFLNSEDQDPATVARLNRISELSGLPPPFLERNADLTDRLEREEELFIINSHLGEDTPSVRRWLQNPDNLSVARGDVEVLTDIERSFPLHTIPSSFPMYGEGSLEETDLDRLQRETAERNINRNVIPPEDREYSLPREVFEDIGSQAREATGAIALAMADYLKGSSTASDVIDDTLIRGDSDFLSESLDFVTSGGPFGQAASNVGNYLFRNLLPDYVDTDSRGDASELQVWVSEHIDALESGSLDMIYENRIATAANDPEGERSFFEGLAHDAGVATGQLAIAAAVSIMTRNATLGQAYMGAIVYGHQYGRSRLDLDRSTKDARQDALVYGFLEFITERIPLRFLMRSGETFGRRILGSMGREGLQESLTEILQTGYDVAVLNEDMTFGEAAYNVMYAGLVGASAGGIVAGATHPMTRDAENRNKANEALNVKREVDKAKENLARTNLSSLNQDMAHSAMAEIMRGKGYESVYVDFENVQSMFVNEDGSYDDKGHVEFLRSIGVTVEQAQEAQFTGEPIEITTDNFVTGIVHGPEGVYEALANDIRIGNTESMTPAEADEFLGLSKEVETVEGTTQEAQAAQEAQEAQAAQAAQETEEGSAGQDIVPVDDSGVTSPPVPEGAKESIRTDTPEFTERFGASKVVDESGEPTLVHHDGPAKIERFDEAAADKASRGTEWTRIGFHFGSEAQAASRVEATGRESPQRTSAYIRMVNPLRLPENRLGRWGPSDVLQALMEAAVDGEVNTVPEADIDAYLEGKFQFQTEDPFLDMDYDVPAQRESIRAYLKSLGYDGIVYANEFEGEGDSYIVLDADQIIPEISNSDQIIDPNNDGFRASIPDKPRDSQDVPPPLWFSGLTRAFEQLAGTQTAPPEQWISIISGLKGVKKEEIETSQVLDFLEWQDPKKPITHERVLQYLFENEVVIEETTFTDAGSRLNDPAVKKFYSPLYREASFGRSERGRSEQDTREDFVEVERGIYDLEVPAVMQAVLGTHVRLIMQSQEWFNEQMDATAFPPRYDGPPLDALPIEAFIDLNKYPFLKGGLEEPLDAMKDEVVAQVITHQGEGERIYYDTSFPRDFTDIQTVVLNSVERKMEEVRSPPKWAHRWEDDGRGASHRLVTPGNVPGTNFEMMIRVPKSISSARGVEFEDSHWDGVGDVVAHVRGNEHTSPDGVRTLVVDEFQSDIHKKARSQRTPMDEPFRRFPKRSDFIIERGDLVDGTERWHVRKKGSNVEELIASGDTQESAWFNASVRILTEAHEASKSEFVSITDSFSSAGSFSLLPMAMDLNLPRNLLHRHLTPDAPFKNNGWVNVLLRRMLRKAADEGFGRVAWTPGYLQAERYGKLYREVGSATMHVTGQLYEPSVDSGRFGQASYSIRVEIELINQRGHTMLDKKFDTEIPFDEDLNLETLKESLDSEQIPTQVAKDIIRIHKENRDVVPEIGGMRQPIAVGDSYREVVSYSPLNEDDNMFGHKGFADFYDTMVGSAMKKIVKRFGGEVKQTEIDTPREGPEDTTIYMGEIYQYYGISALEREGATRSSLRDLDDIVEAPTLYDQYMKDRATERMWSVDLTDEMKEAFKSPQPMFSIRGMPTAEYVNNAEVVTAAMRKRLDAMGLEGVALKVEDIIRRDMDGVTVELEGYYWQGLVAIALEQNRDIMEVLNHEAIHALKAMGVFKDAEWDMLVSAANADDVIMSSIRQKYGNRSQDIQDEEAVAEFFAKRTSEQQQPEGFVADMLNRIRQFFLSIRDAFLEGGFSNIEDLYQAINLGVVGRRDMQERQQKAVNAAIKMFRGINRIAPNTAKFGRWFKQSDAVNSAGSPKILYHATRNDFKAFDTAYAQLGHHFGTLPQASDRVGFSSEVVDMIESGKDMGGMNELRREGANILPVYLSVQKPLISPDMNFWLSPTEWKRSLPKAIPSSGVTERESKYGPEGSTWLAPNQLAMFYTGDAIDAQHYEVWIDILDYLTNSEIIDQEMEANGNSFFGGQSGPPKSYEDGSELSEVRGEFKRAVWDILNSHGFDSLKYRNTAEGQVVRSFEDNSSWSYAVQHSTQIKSAIANNGEYDSANPDIRYSIKDNEDGSKTYDAKPGIDPRMLILLGPNLYGDMSKLPEVTVKEVFQNSFDAIKGLPSDSGSPSGNISIVTNYDETTYYFGDTGTGMTPDILSKAFLNVAGSLKAGSRASGGFGVAKVAFLFNNISIRLATLRDGKLTVMESYGAEIAEALVSGGTIPLNESDYSGDMESVSQKMFPSDEIDGFRFLALSEPLRGAMHGTVMSIKLPREFEDEVGDIGVVDFHENADRLPVMKHSMLMSPIGVYWNGEKLHIGEEISKTEIVPYSQINFAWGSATIYVGPPTESTYRYQSNLHYMSNGLWQFSDNLKENPNSYSSDPVPDHIYIDLRIKVEATDSRYPISLNRQELAFSAKKSIEQVLGYLAAQYMVRNFQKQSVSYGSAEYLDAYDEEGYETEAINLVPNVDFNPSETIVQKISSDDNVTVDDDGVIRVNGKEMPEITPEQMKAFRTAAEIDKLVLPEGSVSTTRPVAHDNTTLREFGGKGILEASRDEFGIDRVNDLMRFIVDSMFEARSIVIDAFNEEYAGPDYSKLDGLTDNVFGVSFDTKYMGVNTKVPINAVFINPAVIAVSMTVYDSDNNSKRLAHAIVGTMLHEFAHEQVRSHDADFADFMGQVYDAFYRSEEGMSLVDEVERYFAQNLEILRWMRDKTRNAELIGSRLKDAGGDQQRSTDGLSGEQPERSGDAGGRDNVPRLVRQGDQDPEGQRDDDGVLPEDDGFRASIAGDESLPEDAPEDGDSSSGVTSHPDPDVELPVALAEFEMGLNGFFENAKEAGMTPKEYEAHLAKVASNAEVTRKRREANVLKQEKRESTKWWKTERQRIAGELENTYRQEHPVYATIHAIENGDARMDRGKVLDNMGNPELMRIDLPRLSGNRTIYTGRDKKEEGMDPQVYAERFDMTTGELLGVMQDAVSLKDQVAIDADRIMRQKHGDILERNQAIDDALEVLAHDGTAEILTDELNALRDAKKQKKISSKLMKEAARQRLQEYKVSNLNPNRFLSTAKKQGQLARKMLRKGDRQGAAKAKFRQLLNFEMAMLAYKAQKDANNWSKYMGKFQKRKGRFPALEAGTVTLIRDRLKAFSMGNRMSEKSRKQIENRRVLARAQGQDLPSGVLREYEATNFRDLSLGQLHALYNEIKNIEATGRNLKKIRLKDKNQEIDAIIEQLIDTLQANVPESKRTEALRGQQSAVQGAKYTLMQLDASIRKVEFLLQRLDGGAMTGAFHRVLFQPVADSQTKEGDMSVKYINTVMEAFGSLPSEIMSRMGERINVPSLHRKMTRGEILMLALNSGNMSNIDKVVRGNKLDIYHKNLPDWTEAGVRNAIGILSKEEGDWVQMVWDTLANIYPEVERIFEVQMGVLPEAIEPSNVEIGGVVRKGGYFPMMYNPDRMVPESKTSPEEIDDAFSSDMRKSSIYSGMTLERSDNYSAPPLLSLSSLPRALHQSIHYVTHFETVQDVKKILHDKNLAEELIRRMGRPYYNELTGWIKAVATSASEPVHVQGFDQTMEFFRANMVAGIMGASLTTGASQAFGTFTSVAVLGHDGETNTFSNFEGQKWMYVGWKATLQNPAEAHEFAVTNSGEMRHRLSNLDRDMRDTLMHAGGETSKIMRWRAGWQRHSLAVIGFAQMWSVDVATWHGAYQKKFSEGDASHLEAVRYADSVVRMSQGSGAVKDLAGFARSRHPLMRTATMFTTYTTVLYNIQAQIVGDTIRNPKKFYQQLFRMAWLTIMPAMADAFLRGEGPDDEDEWAQWFLWKLGAYSVNSIPIGGPMISSVIEGFNPSMSPITQIPTSIARSLQHFGELMTGEDDVSWKTAEAAINAVGYTLGIGGTAQAARFFDALDALEQGTNRDPLYVREFIAGHHDR